jgi:tetratricopeptide (TPR) repeat protein
MVVWPILMVALLVSQQPETLSLLEKPLYAPPLAREERDRREAALNEARAAYERDRASVDAALAVARAQMALGRVGDSLETLTRALEGKPVDPRLSLERGRGFIVIRKFELAAEAFGKCADPGIFAYLADWRTGPSAMPRPAVSREPAPDPSAPIRLPGAATRPGPAMRIPMTATYLDAAERLIKGDIAGAKALLKQIVEKERNRWMDPVYIAAEVDYAKILKAEGKKAKRRK